MIISFLFFQLLLPEGDLVSRVIWRGAGKWGGRYFSWWFCWLWTNTDSSEADFVGVLYDFRSNDIFRQCTKISQNSHEILFEVKMLTTKKMPKRTTCLTKFPGTFFKTTSIIRTSRMTPTWFIHLTQNSSPGLKIEVFAFTFLALEAIEMKKWRNPSRRLPHRNMSQH